MKKQIFSIALAALAVLTVTTSASAAKPEGRPDNNTECQVPGKKKCKKQKHDRRDRCQGADSALCNPFEGLNLTDQQTEALKAIPNPRQVMKAAKQQADTTVCPRTMMQNVRRNYLDQVKQVLTPEQYTQFLENFYVKQMPMKGKKDKKDGQRPQGKNGKHKSGHGPKHQHGAPRE
ncbi:MAG: hypothetical protein K2K79_00620 [Paramuribaculum sp.]|nr:hypothetical protein [Paramuribaculum sp.]